MTKGHKVIIALVLVAAALIIALAILHPAPFMIAAAFAWIVCAALAIRGAIEWGIAR